MAEALLVVLFLILLTLIVIAVRVGRLASNVERLPTAIDNSNYYAEHRLEEIRDEARQATEEMRKMRNG